jgi:predicted Ser/Thr protein kinase
MATTEEQLAELSDDQRKLLETWLIDFDLSWDEDRLATWVRRLPPPGDGLRLPALVEMVKIDLERRWQRGQAAKLEAYVKALPELGPADSIPADLLQAEYEARTLGGTPADLTEYARRFPRQVDELRRLVGTTFTPNAPAAPLRFPDSSIPPDLPTPLPNRPGGRTNPLPETFGRYRILRPLGQGAMGTVYLAHDTQLDRPVALKVPQFAGDDGPEVRQRFLSEARAAATIVHPNVCPVFDVGEINGTPYLTMAYLEGPSLAKLLQGPAPLPAWQAATLVHRLALALQAAHEKGIIHRDLKPSNVMINARGEPVVLDFGLARRLRQDAARLTRIGQPLGTPAYMSPEQVAGAVGVMGPGCDIYSLGVILYQLLTGRLPFEGAVAEVLGQIVCKRPEPPSHYRSDLDPRLEAVCLKALRKEIADRYATMRDLADALADYLRRDRPPERLAPDVGSAPPTRAAGQGAARPKAWFHQPSFRRAVLAAAGAAAVVLLAGIVLRITSSTGTIQIELNDPGTQVEVRLDGEPVERGGLNEPLHLKPGKHHLLVTGGKIQTVSVSFTVAPGANPVLRVRLVSKAGAGPKAKRRGKRKAEHEDDDDDEDDD